MDDLTSRTLPPQSRSLLWNGALTNYSRLNAYKEWEEDGKM